jgi:hypothetical protein
MKILKVKIEVTHNNGATQYVGYPKEWLDNKEKISNILYPGDRTDEVGEGGKLYQIVYPVLPDDLYDKMKNLPICSEPNLAELTAYSDKHAPQVERITDENKVIGILAKTAQGKVLTKADKDALDPENPTPGITKTKRWIDEIKQYGITNL